MIDDEDLQQASTAGSVQEASAAPPDPTTSGVVEEGNDAYENELPVDGDDAEEVHDAEEGNNAYEREFAVDGDDPEEGHTGEREPAGRSKVHADREANEEGGLPLAEELGIEDISCPVFGGRGRLFSAAGPSSPIAEFTQDFLVLHPPQKPFEEDGPAEEIAIRCNEQGVLLDELGQPKQIVGAKFHGRSLWFSGEQKEGTLRHYVIWFDKLNAPHKLYALRPRSDGTSGLEALTSDTIFKLRNRTHDGELSVFPDLQTD